MTDDPSISRDDLAAELGISTHKIRAIAKRLGYERGAGRHGTWLSKTMKPIRIDSKNREIAEERNFHALE